MKLSTKYIITIGIVLLFLVGVVGWFGHKEKEEMRNCIFKDQLEENSLVKENTESETSLDKTLSFSRENFETNKQNLRNLLENISQGKQSFDTKKGTVPASETTFALSDDPLVQIRVSSYKYQKGAYFSGSYEGLQWIIRLDNEVKTFQTLKPGVQEASVMGYLGNEKTLVDFRKIGERYYEVYDLGFKPSGELSRFYVTFDEERSQFVLIVFSFAFYTPEDVQAWTDAKGRRMDNNVYPEEIQSYLNEIEAIIAESIK